MRVLKVSDFKTSDLKENLVISVFMSESNQSAIFNDGKNFWSLSELRDLKICELRTILKAINN